MLNQEVNARDNSSELSYDKPDPLLIARRYRDESIALICALFAYGNAKQIVKFLDSLDFSLLDKSHQEIEKSLGNHYYRFQKSEDIIAPLVALSSTVANLLSVSRSLFIVTTIVTRKTINRKAIITNIPSSILLLYRIILCPVCSSSILPLLIKYSRAILLFFLQNFDKIP
jgi:hypothetical protein